MSQYGKVLSSGASNYIRNVAIVGATGSIGSEITKELLKTGKHMVTAISRADSKSEAPAGVGTRRVDYSDHSSLVEALRGQDILLITLNPTAPRDIEGKLVAAAKDAGLKWVMPNAWGYATIDADDQLGKDIVIGVGIAKTCASVKELGLSYMCLYSGFWEEWSLGGGEDRFGFDIPARSLTLFDDGETKIVTSTLSFCGLAVARLLSLPILPQDHNDESVTMSRWRNQALYIGSFHLSQLDRLESLMRVTGTEKSDWTITHTTSQKRFDDAVAKMQMQTGDRGAMMTRLYTRVFFSDGKSDFTDKLQNDLLDLPKLDVDEMTKEAVRIAMSGGTKY